tara:strand:+ start:4749 stop:5108 length:360 start_codon:yes stop_codon:yes gene_type:complete
MANIVAIKRITFDNISYPTVTDSVEITESGSEKTPILGDNGKVLSYSESLKAGMCKAKFSTLAQYNSKTLKKITGAKMIIELKDGRSYIGSDMTAISNNAEVISDGTIEIEFSGNVEEK